MKKFFLCVVAVLAAGAVSAEYKVDIKGVVNHHKEGDQVTLVKRDGFGRSLIAEAPIAADGSYSMSVTVDKAGNYDMMCCQEQSVSVWIEDENLDVDFRGRDTAKVRMIMPTYVHIKGGPKNRVMDQYNYQNIQAYKRMINAYQALTGPGAVHVSKAQSDSLIRKLTRDNADMAKEDMRYIVMNNQGVSSLLQVITALDQHKDSALIEETLISIEKVNPEVVADYRRDKAEKEESIRNSSVGAQAPNLALLTEKGKKVELSKYFGKVLIIDFWASWCGPCRAEIPKLKAIAEDFKGNKNVAFLSISIDEDKDAWLKAVEKEAMPWTQLQAPETGKEAMHKYQFTGIPFIICVSPDGKIFRKQLRGEAVRNAINDCLAASGK